MFVQNHHRTVAFAAARARRLRECGVSSDGAPNDESRTLPLVRAYGFAETASENDDPVDAEGDHPEARKLWLVSQEDDGSLRRVPVNRVFEFSNDHAVGSALAMVRARDNDDDASSLSPFARGVAERLRRSGRRLEFQFRFRLRRPLPPGATLYGAVEFEKEPRPGPVGRAAGAAALAFLRGYRRDVHATLSPRNGERAHAAIPVFSGVDRLVETPPGATPPELGREIEEDPASARRRLSGQCAQTWDDTETTYTACVISECVDFLRWRAVDVPGLPPIPITSVFGHQAIIASIYCLRAGDEHAPHTEDRKFYISRMEISLEGIVEGPRRRRWNEIASTVTYADANWTPEQPYDHYDSLDDVELVNLRNSLCGLGLLSGVGFGGEGVCSVQRGSLQDSLLWRDIQKLNQKQLRKLRYVYNSLRMNAMDRKIKITDLVYRIQRGQ